SEHAFLFVLQDEGLMIPVDAADILKFSGAPYERDTVVPDKWGVAVLLRSGRTIVGQDLHSGHISNIAYSAVGVEGYRTIFGQRTKFSIPLSRVLRLQTL